MKNPISFLTFSSLSLSLYYLSRYLYVDGTSDAEGILRIVENNAIFTGISQLSYLAFGAFLYCRDTDCARSENPCNSRGYFSFFSLLLLFLVPVLIFAHSAYIFAALWAAVLMFFLAILLFSEPKAHIGVLCLGLPAFLLSVGYLALSVIGIAVYI